MTRDVGTSTRDATLKEILKDLDRWTADGEEIALATVVAVEGSAPRPSGARLGLTRSGAMTGSVSGGCVESDVYERSLSVLDSGAPTLTAYGPAEPDSFEVGLSCDGNIEVLIERFRPDAVWNHAREAIENDEPAALAIAISPPSLLGRRLSLKGEGEEGQERVGSIDPAIDDVIAKRALELLRGRGRGSIDIERNGEACRIFVEAFVPAQRLYVVGATHIAISLCRMAREVGFRVTVIDPREAFSGGDRFEDAHAVRKEWPVDVLDGVLLNTDAYVLTLTHDPKFDIPTLARALRSDVRYIGALGSRGTHAKRLEKLRAEGFTESALARIRTPIGLDIGARTPSEIALSILAELVAVRHDKGGAPMAEAISG
jgi:xanthine dehydrogenase accessory factor